MVASEDSVHHSMSSCMVAVAAFITASNQDNRYRHDQWIDLAEDLRA